MFNMRGYLESFQILFRSNINSKFIFLYDIFFVVMRVHYIINLWSMILPTGSHVQN